VWPQQMVHTVKGKNTNSWCLGTGVLMTYGPKRGKIIAAYCENHMNGGIINAKTQEAQAVTTQGLMMQYNLYGHKLNAVTSAWCNLVLSELLVMPRLHSSQLIALLSLFVHECIMSCRGVHTKT
jgi:hypothetical protein